MTRYKIVTRSYEQLLVESLINNSADYLSLYNIIADINRKFIIQINIHQ